MVKDQLTAQQVFFPGTDQIKAGGALDASIGTKISAANASLSATPKTDPNYETLQADVATLNGQKTTLFTGEMLRATLLNSWGWWTLGLYTTYAGIGLLIAGLGMLGALVFEVFATARKPESVKVKIGQKVTA